VFGRLAGYEDAALDRLRARDFDGTLLGFVDGLLTGAARQAPDLPDDSWPQLDQFEWLEELRQFRPALFKALKPQTADRGPQTAASVPPSTGLPPPLKLRRTGRRAGGQ